MTFSWDKVNALLKERKVEELEVLLNEQDNYELTEIIAE